MAYTLAASPTYLKRDSDEKSDTVRGCNEKANINEDYYSYRIQ